MIGIIRQSLINDLGLEQALMTIPRPTLQWCAFEQHFPVFCLITLSYAPSVLSSYSIDAGRPDNAHMLERNVVHELTTQRRRKHRMQH